MFPEGSWPTAEPIEARSLILEPLDVEDAPEVAAALDDPELHFFTGGRPATADELRTRFELLVVGESPDRSQGWLNWVLRDKDSMEVVGTVQATLVRRDDGDVAEVAWTVGTPWQGQGKGKDAASALVGWLSDQGADVLVAHIHPEHSASTAVALSLGLKPTDVFVDGERCWERQTPAEPNATDMERFSGRPRTSSSRRSGIEKQRHGRHV